MQMIEKTLPQAFATAVEFTVESIRQTVAHENHNWYGVDFESAIPKLLTMLND